MSASQLHTLADVIMKRDESGAQKLLDLLANPFSSQLQQGAIWASLGTSFGFTILIAVLFSFLRPYNSVVYAPKLKHADDQHAPPPMGKGIFAWFGPLVKTKEQELIPLIGLDATVFLRFTRMCRNIFTCISIIGCGVLIPVFVINGNQQSYSSSITWLQLITPLNTYNSAQWATVICAYIFNIIVAGFLWWNYRKVLALRRHYFNSIEYQNSLHARTLMINDLPKEFRSDEGLSRILDQVRPDSSFSRTAVARNVKELPQLIAQHDHTVRKLEKILAKYLQNPDQLPKTRPEIKPSKKDPSYGSYVRGQKVDAIEYLTGRIRDLEAEIKEVRLSVDKRNAMSYGFASFEDIAEAHSIAYAGRKKHPHGTTVVLAPRPNDVIWTNMPLTKSARRWKGILNNFWVTILTFIWIAPNIMIAIFLVNLANLGLVWPAFRTNLEAHTAWWSIVQGVASPALTSLIFLLLPIIFRRMSNRAGELTKTARERHVMAKLYSFFIFNNLIVFSVFSTLWNFISSVIKNTQLNEGVWQAIQDSDLALSLFISLCQNSPFWVTYLLQRNLGAAVDLAQLWTLIWSFCARKFSSPTPREIIELTAPPAFDYASYYNYFLYYATVTLCFAALQPLVIPAAAVYFFIDVYLKKYLLLYIFITKTESGGMFWRSVFNRMVFASMMASCVVFLAVWVRGDANHIQAYCIVPLPFLMVAFKIFCSRAYDDKIHFLTTKPFAKDVEVAGDPVAQARKMERLAARYGHPALYRPLITPMVHARAQNILASIYRGRLTDSGNQADSDMTSVSGYSDTFALGNMKRGAPGKSEKDMIPGFELVPENHLDFSYYKGRSEFADEHGGGQIFSRPNDLIDRTGAQTPGTYRYDSPVSTRPSSAMGHVRNMTGSGSTLYDGAAGGDIGRHRPMFSQGRNDSDTHLPLVGSAAEMPASTPMFDDGPQLHDNTRADVPGRHTAPAQSRAPGFLGGGPRGYGELPHEETEFEEATHGVDTSYDYYRQPRTRNAGAGGNMWTG